MAVANLELLCRAGGEAGCAAAAATEPGGSALADGLEQPVLALRAVLESAGFQRSTLPSLQLPEARSLLAAARSQLLPPARQLAAALLQW